MEPATGTAERIQELLSQEELVEFQMRTSPVAQRLLRGGFAFNEIEFRKAYLALATADAKPIVAGAVLNPMQVAAQETPGMQNLKTALGPDRFAQYAKAQDPAFGILKAVATTYRLTPDKVEGAYRLRLERGDRAGPRNDANFRKRQRYGCGKLVRPKRERSDPHHFGAHSRTDRLRTEALLNRTALVWCGKELFSEN